MLFLLTNNLIYCKEVLLGNAFNNENNSKSLHPTSSYSYDFMTSTLSPTSSLFNDPPMLLYPKKLPKYIEQKDNIDMKKSAKKNKNKKKKKSKKKNKNKKINNKKKKKNDRKHKK